MLSLYKQRQDIWTYRGTDRVLGLGAGPPALVRAEKGSLGTRGGIGYGIFFIYCFFSIFLNFVSYSLSFLYCFFFFFYCCTIFIIISPLLAYNNFKNSFKLCSTFVKYHSFFHFILYLFVSCLLQLLLLYYQFSLLLLFLLVVTLWQFSNSVLVISSMSIFLLNLFFLVIFCL